MEKRDVFRYLMILIILVFFVSLLIITKPEPTGFAVFEQSNEGDFNNGTYANTTYNGSAVVLAGENLTGTYISKIFDAGGNADWNNLIPVKNEQDIEYLYAVDGAGDVYKSANFGINWTQTADDYGRTTTTNYLFSDGTYFYILTGTPKEIWRSSDGNNWNIINDTFSDYILLVGENFNENLFIIDSPGNVYKSTDYGVSWKSLIDFNPGVNDAKGIAVSSFGSLFVVDGAGTFYMSSDFGETWIEQNSYYGGGSGTDDMVIDSSNNLYILLNKKIYKSADYGASWSIINNSFTHYLNDGFRMHVTSDDLFFIADGAGRIFESADFGISWVEKGDFNAVASNDPKGLTSFIQNTDTSFQVRNCSQLDCSDGEWQNNDLNNLDLISRYFQYKVVFSSPDASITPDLDSLTIGYDLIEAPQDDGNNNGNNNGGGGGGGSSGGGGGSSSPIISKQEELKYPDCKSDEDCNENEVCKVKIGEYYKQCQTVEEIKEEETSQETNFVEEEAASEESTPFTGRVINIIESGGPTLILVLLIVGCGVYYVTNSLKKKKKR